MSFGGFRIVEQLYESQNSLVYRGIHLEDEKHYILKTLKSDYPQPSEIKHFQQEFEITKSIESDGVIRVIDQIKQDGNWYLVLEDFGAESLEKLLQSKRLPLLDILKLALQMVKALEDIHNHRVIHKDINPSNMVLNRERQVLKVIDFGISTKLPREKVVLADPSHLEGTLAYMSPEQTGRMNRFVDYRSDYYSLGITLYELLCHQLPFQSRDPMEMVHNHLARMPLPPHKVEPTIPNTVSALVLKLMAKTAEERYLGAPGILADIRKCIDFLEKGVPSADFVPGSEDVPSQLDIPQTLYGREQEIQRLQQVFDRVAHSGQTEWVLVKGYSGIGKTSVVQEIYRSVTRENCFYISGKFDQFNRIPYSALASAFRDLIRQLLTKSETELQDWRSRIVEALGPNGQVIVEVVPETALIIGPQPPVASLGPIETNNRFRMVFLNFLRVFSRPNQPLAIFLDDLQWADALSLDVIELILTDDASQNLLLIGAYRDNEVSPAHPLTLAIEAIQKQGVSLEEIALKELEPGHVRQLLSDTLLLQEDDVAPLGDLVYHKTGGNPFFVCQFLETLNAEGLVRFTKQAGDEVYRWRWEIDQIEQMSFTDNVVDLMVGKLKKLPEATQDLLRYCSCIGNVFDLETLGVLYDLSPRDAYTGLQPAAEAGFILPISELTTVDTEDEKAVLLVHEYKFLHDRVQQAAYALIPDDQKKQVHLTIGRTLIQHFSPEVQDERVFALVDHLHKGRSLIESREEKNTLIRLCLTAARKAKQATAYESGRNYLVEVMADLPADFWATHYRLAMDLYRLRIDLEGLNGHYDVVDAFAEVAIAQAQTVLEKAQIYNQLIIQYTVTAKYVEAIDLGRKALEWLGVTLPAQDLDKALLEDRESIASKLKGRQILDLVNLPPASQPEMQLAHELLSNLMAPTFLAQPDLMPLVCSKAIHICLDFGDSPGCVLGYSLFGLVLGTFFEEYRDGYDYGLLGLRVAEKYDDRNQKCQAIEVLLAHVGHWVRPIAEMQALVKDGFQAGIEVGNQQWAGYIIYYDLSNSFVQGIALEKCLPKLEEYTHYLHKTQNSNPLRLINSYELVIWNLSGRTEHQDEFHNREFDATGFLKACADEATLMAEVTFAIHRGQVHYLYGQYDKALPLLEEAEGKLMWTPGTTPVGDYHFYHALTLAQVWLEADPETQKSYEEKLAGLLAKLALFKDNCEANFLHKYLLVKAEMARLKGHFEEALDHYDAAIASAGKHEFIQNEALASECAAKFWMARGNKKIGVLYLREALFGYRLWGAKRKVAMIEQAFPQIIRQNDRRNLSERSTQTHLEALDLLSVLKASRTISSEIHLNDLLQKLMLLLIENAGAQRGVLLAERNKQWIAEASADAETNQVTFPNKPLENDQIASTIVTFVQNTHEHVVLDDAQGDHRFSDDPYICRQKPKSVVCFPVLHHNKVSAVLYLENNLTTGAFTKDRLQVLEMLSAQAAVSIENARLYLKMADYSRTLEKNVADRTAELQERNRELKVKNEQVLSSILYAEHIQAAILPRGQEMREAIPRHFVFYRPRDIVSGDFYWVHQKGEQTLLAIVDCTGHGVPGALMTMIGHTLLNKVLGEVGMNSPAAILEQLHMEVRQVLKQNLQRRALNDGMQVAMCSFKRGVNRFVFAGAGQSLFWVSQQAGKRVLEVVRGDRREIGGWQKEARRVFTDHELQANPGDTIYMATDGFRDQNNREKKYGSHHFKQFLFQLADRPIEEQSQALARELDEFQGSEKQRDDITVLGLRF